MKIKLSSLLFAVSLFFNLIFILLMIAASLSKASLLSFFSPKYGYTSAAFVLSYPSGNASSFGVPETSLVKGEKAFLQFSVFSEGKQSNMLINSLYDRDIVSVSPTGYGIEITALNEGETLMQTFTNEGIKDILYITVEK